jgi:hypothetical protein
MLEEAGLLSKERLLAGDFPDAFDAADGPADAFGAADGEDREGEDREVESETDERLQQ